MANENKEFGDIVKKSKILLLDIEGTTTSISFVKDKLFPYAEENVKSFLDSQWDTEDVKEVVAALRKLAVEDKESNVEGVVAIPGEDASKEDQIEGLVKSVKWQMAADRKVGPLKQLQGLVWKQGYDKGDVKGHVFDDVSPALEQWQSAEIQKVYIYSSGSVQAQKLLFAQSTAGDLLRFIDGYFDTAVGAKTDAASYTNIVEKIGCKAEEILFLTDIVKEAAAASEAGLNAALVSREGNEPLSTEAKNKYPVIHSLAELTVSNKRKPEPQDEVPAKIPKTDNEDLKQATETTSSETTDTKETEKPEKMEVEENVTTSPDKEETKEGVVVEEITDSNEAVNVAPVDAQPVVEEVPVVEEKEEKTEEKQTEKMEIENVKPSSGQTEVKKDKEEALPAVDDTPTTIITEIEETSDKQLSDVADIIEDLVPVVEEPTDEDMEDLQNAGEVLEKECNEILSKVQDVTDLVNMPLKSSLKPIAEETMETENLDTNDVVERILDRELEMEMKQCEDIDLNTVTEITDDVKKPEVNGVTDKTDTNDTSNVVSETKPTENKSDANSVTERNDAEISPAVTNTEEIKIDVQNSETKGKESPVEVKAIEPEKPKVSKESDIVAEDVKAEEKAEDVKPKEDKPASAEVKPASKEIKPASEEIKPVLEEVKPASEEVRPAAEESMTVVNEGEQIATEAKSIPEEKPITEESKPDNETKETQVNGKATNGDTDAVNLNGDTNKDEELSSRLSVENGAEVVNGSNGNSMEGEQGQGDCKVEAEVSDIKVKTITTEESRTDPIEQPTEA